MPAPVSFGKIETCKNQKDAFKLIVTPNTGVDLTGARATCQVRSTAQPGTPLMVPSVSSELVGVNMEFTFTWTDEQSAALPSSGATFSAATTVHVEVDVFLSDDPTEEAARFTGTLAVHPGGNLPREA